MSSLTPDRYRARLHQIAADWGVNPLGRIDDRTIPAAGVTPQDEAQAEALLRQRREADSARNSQSFARRFASRDKKPWDSKEVYDALNHHVNTRGSPGVAAALVHKLMALNVDLGGNGIKQKTNILNRRKSVENFDRGLVLEYAIRNRHPEMLAVLVPHADALALQAALPAAIRSGHLEIVKLMFRYGANVGSSQAAVDALRQLCITGSNAELVGLMLQADSASISPEWQSTFMVYAAEIGCLHTVQRLSCANAEASYNNAAALRSSIKQRRIDIALALLIGNKPPAPGGQELADCFTELYNNQDIPNEHKLPLIEALLCAGAKGDAVSSVLQVACATDHHHLINLLLSYGASVEYQDAFVVRQAVRAGRPDLVQLLLRETVVLSPTYASECVTYISREFPHEVRYQILFTLLQRGAEGSFLHNALVDAVHVNDVQSVELLLTPVFPGGGVPVNGNYHGNRAPGMVYDRHAIASVDHKNGLALNTAIVMGNFAMAQRLLEARPQPATLVQVFPQVKKLQPKDRYAMTEQFLLNGLTGPSISTALAEAIEERPPRRDPNFISLLMNHSSNVNDDGGASIMAAITTNETILLKKLLEKGPAANTLAAAVPAVMMIEHDKLIRYQMVQMLIGAGAGRQGAELSMALAQLLSVKPVDMQLAALLLEQGRADVNFDQGASVMLAIQDPDPNVLGLLCQYGSPTSDTLSRALIALSEMLTTAEKVSKVNALLRHAKQREILAPVLLSEVKTVLKSPASQRHYGVVASLLSAGADVNFQNGEVLTFPVKDTDEQLYDMLFAARTLPTSLAPAFGYAVHISDPMSRFIFTRKLLDAGVPSSEVNRVLVDLIKTNNNQDLFELLVSRAEVAHGEALREAIKCQNSADVVEIVLAKSPGKYSAPILRSAFQEAMRMKDKEKRVAVCRSLLQRGVPTQVASQSLMDAAKDGDITLGAVLIEYGASVEHQEGQAIVAACGAGAPEVVKMLLSGQTEIRRQALTKGFEEAALVKNLKKRVEVFRLLLERGVESGPVNAQLASAVESGNDGEGLVRLLVEFGADVNYNSGQAVWHATRDAVMGSLKVMLGVEKVGGSRQVLPTQSTMLKSLRTSRKLDKELRYQVVKWLFDAGLSACEDVDTALIRAVKDVPDIRLIRLLLQNGASPTANGCEALIDAAQRHLADVVVVLLEVDIPPVDISYAFQQAFVPDKAPDWLIDQGFRVAHVLLEKGAEGYSLTLALAAAFDAFGTHRDEIARRFADLFLRYNVDVSHQDGILVQKAAQMGDPRLIQLVLEKKPHSYAVSIAFPYIFGLGLAEEDVLNLISLFTEYHDGEERLDTAFTHPHFQPVLFRALDEFPRSLKIFQTLLHAGYYHDQTTMMRVSDEFDEDEEVSLLFWALYQPQKRVSSSIIEVLIEQNPPPNVNFETRLSKTTPLMLAIQNRRPDLTRTLILAGAEVDVVDVNGNTPMTMATEIGGDLGTAMMQNILAADPSINDGSLHNAARDLNLKALKTLIDFGHDLDFPSPIHGGRSAIGELCLNAANNGPLSALQEKHMEKAMQLLIKAGTDLSIQANGKSVLLLALNSADPVPTTRALLKVGMWRHVNSPWNQYNDGTYTYSPSQYAARVLPMSEHKHQLLELLKANRAIDVYYANDGPQPEGACNLPEELLRAERERRARLERISKEEDDHKIALARTKELAKVHNEIFITRAELEDARARRQRDDEIEGVRYKQEIEAAGFAAELRRRQQERQAVIEHEQKLIDAGVRRVRMISAAESDSKESQRRKEIAYQTQINAKAVDHAHTLSSIRLQEQQEFDRLSAQNDTRTMKRLQEHKKLVDSQNALAGRLTSAGIDGRRQVGYITGEAD